MIVRGLQLGPGTRVASKGAHQPLRQEVVAIDAGNEEVLTEEFLEDLHGEAAPSDGVGHSGEHPVNFTQQGHSIARLAGYAIQQLLANVAWDRAEGENN